ncbi:hypothetical protein C0Q70_00914 [Pomacea canaliculata]|uniref:CN hydrolase domain-containing protein n=1 Tax=Pomacea canaliculata TaxID=400727 RepID=A0A2T7PXZ1_POMCA|nr:hypothetical protein C0Q70_00914 [Pomacea canaliculata]
MTGMRQLAVPGCLMLITVLALAEVKQRPWTYRASVFAHRPLLPSETFPVSRTIAVKNMMKNVVIYRQQAQHAAKQGAQIIVYPEDGLYGYLFNRVTIKPYLEPIPDPWQVLPWVPCTDPGRVQPSDIMVQLSCIASADGKAGLEVGLMLMNWDKLTNGHHKYRLSYLLDRGISFTQRHRDSLAWARGNRVNLLAANIHMPALGALGSGVYTSDGPIDYYYDDTASSEGRLIVVDVPGVPVTNKREPGLSFNRFLGFGDRDSESTTLRKMDVDVGSAVYYMKAASHVVASSDVFLAEIGGDLFRMVDVTDGSGSRVVCAGRTCCQLTYRMSRELAHPGLLCFRSIRGRPHFREELIQYPYVYPEVLVLRNDSLSLTAPGEWNYSEGRLQASTPLSQPLLVASLYARDYSRDP